MDAPLGSVELGEAYELERLRRRAYGPDADIAGDAAAQARLSELEARQRRQATPVVETTVGVSAPISERIPGPEPVEAPRATSTTVPKSVDGAFARPEPAGGSVIERDPAVGRITDSEPTDGATGASWWRRRRWTLIGGAIAALALNAAAVGWMSQLLADEATSHLTDTTAKIGSVPGNSTRLDDVPAPDYVLALESVGIEADVPNDPHGTLNLLGVSSDELRRYEDFRGLSVWSGESRYGIACLFVAASGQGLREGLGAEGCSPQGLGTVAELLEMPSDGLIRFVLRGDQVNVYVYQRNRPVRIARLAGRRAADPLNEAIEPRRRGPHGGQNHESGIIAAGPARAVNPAPKTWQI